MFKPIAFCLSIHEIEGMQFYASNIKLYTSEIHKYNLNIWYIGDLLDNDTEFLFSFPQTKNLLDRNIVISIKKDQIEIENDWLGSLPIFYNQKELIVSTIPNFCLINKTINSEGLINFFKFGYSVFEHTPFEEVKFLRYYSKLIINNDSFEIEYKDDPILERGLFEKKSSSSKAIDDIKKYIANVEQGTSGEIILPTSGGFDSRLLNWAITDKEKIRSYTYGISKDQSKSSESIYAGELSKILNTKWEHIELTHFHDYIDDWHRLFGFTTHLHGMYHIEFYDKILSLGGVSSEATLLSGIIGDAWAGSINKIEVSNINDLKKLGYSHNLELSNSFLIKKSTDTYNTRYFNKNKSSLDDHHIQIVMMMRLKLMLLSYLTKVPEYFGIPVWTPFLNFNIAVTMLQLPADLRENRNWQRSFFKEVGLDIENMELDTVKSNSLDFEMSKDYKFSPIDENCFENFIKINKIINLNKKINSINKNHELFENFLVKFRIRGIFRKLGIKNVGYLTHLSNYFTLKAIEKSLK